MHSCEPDLLDVLGKLWIERPQVLPKCSPLFINRNSLATNLDVWVGSGERQRQRIVQPTDRAYRVPHTHEVHLALARESGLEIGGQGEVGIRSLLLREHFQNVSDQRLVSL